jgi:transketolase
MSNRIANRQAICDELMQMAETDQSIVVLCSDSRGSASMKPFADQYPDQFIETGIAEQNIVGIAAGLASCGKKPIVASPAAFLSARAAEQVKVDVAYSHMNVVLLGISGGISYGALGMSHHSLQDIALMRAIPGIDVILPCDRFESQSVIRDLMKNPRPAYVRVGRNAVADVFSEDTLNYQAGKATKLHDGKDAAVIATGETVRFALDAAIALEREGIQIQVFDMHTLKPFDTEAVNEASKTGYIITMEEHSIYGGLGAAVSQQVCKVNPCRVDCLAIPDEPAIAGDSKDVFEYYGVSVKHVIQLIHERSIKIPQRG